MFHSLTTRLIAWSLVLTGATYVTTIGLSNRAGRASAIAAAEREANDATDAAAHTVGETLAAAEESAAALGRAVSELQPAPEATARLVRRFSEDNRDRIARYAVVVARDGSPEPDWVRQARQRGTAGWSAPYHDAELPEETVITYAVPLTGQSGPAGVVGASLRLDFLSAVVRKVRLGASGFAVVITDRGLAVAHSRIDLSSGTFDPLANLPPALRGVIEPIVERARAGESAFSAIPIEGRTYRLTLRPIAHETGWVLATAYAEDELLADVSSLRRTQIAASVAGLAVLALAIVVLSRRITRPLGALAASAGRLGTGDLDGPLPAAVSRDEVGTLTSAFRDMRDSLKTHIRTLQETTAAKERLEAEMRAARRIQADMLPIPAAGDADYELAAALVPARAVGGDLFDHFSKGRQVCFLIADVSGKGVAAALFMARTKTLFDGIAAVERDPGTVLSMINRSLCRQNDAGMYVTGICGVLDLDASAVTLAIAGHEPPVIVKANGHVHQLHAEGGRVLGLIDAGEYPVARVALERGDALVMFTDGVSEAQNQAGEFFGAERLLAAVAQDPAGQASAITDTLLRAVKTFADAAPQSDDITILTVRLPIQAGQRAEGKGQR